MGSPCVVEDEGDDTGDKVIGGGGELGGLGGGQRAEQVPDGHAGELGAVADDRLQQRPNEVVVGVRCRHRDEATDDLVAADGAVAAGMERHTGLRCRLRQRRNPQATVGAELLVRLLEHLERRVDDAVAFVGHTA